MSYYLKWTIALNFFELAACIIGFINWKKIKDTYWKWFPVYLAIIFTTEIVAEYIGNVLKLTSVTSGIYFFFAIPFQFLFFCWLFSRWYSVKKERLLSWLGAIVFIVSWALDYLFIGEKKQIFLSFSYTVGNIVLLILMLQFFISFVNSNKILSYKTEPMFWVSLGLLIFYLMTFPFFGLWNTLVTKYPDFFIKYWLFQMILNCSMYSFFSLAFILGKWKQHSS